MPLDAGESEVSLEAIYGVDARRAVCMLTAPDGTAIVGIYAVDDGRMSAACHYFSDDERLGTLGASHATIPPALIAAIKGFQQELANVRVELRTLRRASETRPPRKDSRARRP